MEENYPEGPPGCVSAMGSCPSGVASLSSVYTCGSLGWGRLHGVYVENARQLLVTVFTPPPTPALRPSLLLYTWVALIYSNPFARPRPLSVTEHPSLHAGLLFCTKLAMHLYILFAHVNLISSTFDDKKKFDFFFIKKKVSTLSLLFLSPVGVCLHMPVTGCGDHSLRGQFLPSTLF